MGPRHLEKAGHLIGVVRMNGKDVRGTRFLRRDVDRVLEKLRALSSAPIGGIAVITYARKNAMSPGEVAAAVLEGRLRAGRVENGEVGFETVRISMNTGYAYRKSALDGGVVSTADACAMTNLEYAVIAKLAAAGRLGPEIRTGSLRTFDRDVVETFAERYRPAAEFAAPLRTSVGELLDRLRYAGVEILREGHARNPPVCKAAAMAALGFSRDPTRIEDVGFEAFWRELLALAATHIPHFRFPRRLPVAGQKVWRSNRKVSVTVKYDFEARCLQVRRAHAKSDATVPAWLSLRIADGPKSAVEFIERLNRAAVAES